MSTSLHACVSTKFVSMVKRLFERNITKKRKKKLIQVGECGHFETQIKRPTAYVTYKVVFIILALLGT